MNDIALSGCTPEPLSGYLAGLGVLRLVAEQVDDATEGRWAPTGFVLRSPLDDDELVSFFLDRYVPTPLVSPWNKGGGLRRDGKSAAAEHWVAELEAADDPRLAPYRETIAAARRISDDYPDVKDLVSAKEEVIRRARSEFPDAALPWIDAAVVLTEHGAVYPHILGTGGNLGRLDLTSNALRHLRTVLDDSSEKRRRRSRRLLQDALFGSEQEGRTKASTGQYDPGHAGGVNNASGDAAEALVNPWSFLLAMEGALLFASGAARRLSAATTDSVAAMPFTVRPSAAGAAHLSPGEQPKGELWLPLWGIPIRLAEVRRLFGEARLQWGRQHAVTALDAVRAVSSFGAERGIESFTRVVIAERLGQNPLAVPAGRVSTQPHPGTLLTRKLDDWVGRLRRRSQLPASIASALRRFDEAVYDTAVSRTEAQALQRLLKAAAELDAHVGANRHLRGELPPLPPLEPDKWLPALDDGTAEFAVAATLASLHEHAADPRRGRHDPGGSRWRACVRDYLRPVWEAGRFLRWTEEPRVDISALPLVEALSSIQVLHATRPRPPREDETDNVGHDIRFGYGPTLDRRIVEAFAAGLLDEDLVRQLLAALVLLRPATPMAALVASERETPQVPVPAWRVLAPVVHGRPLSVNTPDGKRDVWLRPRQDWPAALHRGATRPVLAAAITRYRVAGLTPRLSDPDMLARAADGQRLNAALLLGLGDHDVAWLVSRATALELAAPSDNNSTGRPEALL